MFSLFSPKKLTKANLVLDIGSKSVGGAIFNTAPSGRPHLLYAVREPIGLSIELTGHKLQRDMLKSLNKVLVRLDGFKTGRMKRGNHRTDSISAVISSPWHASETKILSLKFGKPTIITKATVDNLSAEEEKSFEKSLAGSEQTAGGFELLERKIIEMRLNGYSTGKPYGKTASMLEVLMFESVAPSNLLQEIKSAVAKHFPPEHLRFHTFSSAAFASLRDLFPETEDFLIIQIDGEVTDVSVVKKGIILGTVSFPVGHNSILRTLSDICEGHPNCTLESLLSMHGKKAAAAHDTEKVERAIAETKQRWLEQFNSVIGSFSSEAFLPKSVFLFEDGSYASLFQKFLSEVGSDQFTITAEPFAVTIIGSELAPTFAEIPKTVLSDSPLSIEANFIARLEKERA